MYQTDTADTVNREWADDIKQSSNNKYNIRDLNNRV